MDTATSLRYKHDILFRVRNHSVKRDDGCIEFRPELKHKYGLISITVDGKHKNVPAHRALWMAIHERWDLPRSIVIRHKCDNPRCVNEDHLVEGAHKDNMRDKFERGRNAKKYRLHTRHRHFTDEQIKAIRGSAGKLKVVAEEFGTTTGYVSKLRNMKAKTLVI